MKKFMYAVIALLLAGIIGIGVYLGIVTNGYRDWSRFQKDEEQQEEPAEKEPEQPKEEWQGTVTDGEGNELVSGTIYAMPAQMIYDTPTPLAASASDGITIKATITPEDVTNKAIDFSFNFADPGSEWASGKEASAYISVTQAKDGAAEAVVKCLAPFGEQIVITATTRAHNEEGEPVSATCTVDYLQKPESIYANIGDVAVVLGGDTNVTVCIGKNIGGDGGTVTLTKTLSADYTIAETYTEIVSFSFEYYEQGVYGDYFAYERSGGMGEWSKVSYDEIENAVGRNIYFDRRLFTDYNFKSENSSFVSGESQSYTTLFSELDANTIKNSYFEPRKNTKLWDITITLTGTHRTYTYTSTLRWAEIDETVPVGDLTFEQDGIIF